MLYEVITTKVIELNPYLPDGYASRGILYYMLKKYKEALKDYEKVIELKNDEASFRNNFV